MRSDDRRPRDRCRGDDGRQERDGRDEQVELPARPVGDRDRDAERHPEADEDDAREAQALGSRRCSVHRAAMHSDPSGRGSSWTT